MIQRILDFILCRGLYVLEYDIDDVEWYTGRWLSRTAVSGCAVFGGCPVTGVFRRYSDALKYKRAIADYYIHEYPIIPTTIIGLTDSDIRVVRYKEINNEPS